MLIQFFASAPSSNRLIGGDHGKEFKPIIPRLPRTRLSRLSTECYVAHNDAFAQMKPQ